MDVIVSVKVIKVEIPYLSEKDIQQRLKRVIGSIRGLNGNNISNILPLVENSGISEGGSLFLIDNLLGTVSVDVYIHQLKTRGVTVIF